MKKHTKLDTITSYVFFTMIIFPIAFFYICNFLTK